LSSSSITLPTTAIRTHAVFSANDNNLLPPMLSAPRNVHLGSGQNLYDFTYAPNLAHAHVLAAQNLLSVTPAEPSNPASAAGKPFFVTNAEPLPFRTFMNMLWAADDARRGREPAKAKAATIPRRLAWGLTWVSCWSLMNIEYHFYGNTTDIYSKIQERTLVLLW
jgi:sterol-4alpha-carboxylate 3-dehydrogenase (decarboxylating)